MLLASCAGPGQGSQIEHPTGNQLVFRISTQGGFIGPNVPFTAFPAFSLQGDGRVIVPGAQPAIYPGPALPAVNVRTLTEAGMQTVLAEIMSTGVFSASAEYRGARSHVADAPDTIFTLRAAGRTVTILVYALGIVQPDDSQSGMSKDELAVHASLLHLGERLMTLEAWLPATAWADSSSAPYQPDAMRLLVRNADDDPPDPSGIDSPLVAWPTADDPASFGGPVTTIPNARCGVVAGAEAATWYQALSTANQLTRFTHGGHRYAVQARFLLPDEAETCPDRLI